MSMISINLIYRAHIKEYNKPLNLPNQWEFYLDLKLDLQLLGLMLGKALFLFNQILNVCAQDVN